ncbi:MAG: hypothetical protein QM791_08760 [Ferruginibacter sp.]
MKQKIISFLLIYVLVPLIVTYLTVKSGNYFGLFGIACYYLGVFIVQFRLWLFFPIPVFFCLWYWYTYGFALRDYVAIYFLCMAAGLAVYMLYNTYLRYTQNVLPETEENLKYNDKLEEMERRILRYQKEHPGEKITQEIIDRIKTDVFFH